MLVQRGKSNSEHAVVQVSPQPRSISAGISVRFELLCFPLMKQTGGVATVDLGHAGSCHRFGPAVQ